MLQGYFVVRSFRTLEMLSMIYDNIKVDIDNFKKTKEYDNYFSNSKGSSLLERFCEYLDNQVSEDDDFESICFQKIYQHSRLLPISINFCQKLYFEGDGIPYNTPYRELLEKDGKIVASQFYTEQ